MKLSSSIILLATAASTTAVRPNNNLRRTLVQPPENKIKQHNRPSAAAVESMTLPQLAMELLKVDPDDISAADMESARRKLSSHGWPHHGYFDYEHLKEFLCDSLAHLETYVPNCPQTAHPTLSPTLAPSFFPTDSPTGKSGKSGTVPPVSGKSGKSGSGSTSTRSPTLPVSGKSGKSGSGSTSTGSPTADPLPLPKAAKDTEGVKMFSGKAEKMSDSAFDGKAAKATSSPVVVVETQAPVGAKAEKATSSPVGVVATLSPTVATKAGKPDAMGKTRMLGHHGGHYDDYIDDKHLKELKEVACYLAALVWDMDPIICDPTDHPTVSPSDSPTDMPTDSPTGKSGKSGTVPPVTGKSGKSGGVPPVSGKSGKSGSTSTGSPTADSLLPGKSGKSGSPMEKTTSKAAKTMSPSNQASGQGTTTVSAKAGKEASASEPTRV